MRIHRDGGSEPRDGYTYSATTGFLTQLKYPSGLKVKYIYTSKGYLCQLVDSTSTNGGCAGTNLVYWQPNIRDAEMHALLQTAGDPTLSTSLRTTQVYQASTGRIQQIRASNDGADDGSVDRRPT